MCQIVTSHKWLKHVLIIALVLMIGFLLTEPLPALAEGSRTLFPQNPAPACGVAAGNACRANMEWSPGGNYAGVILRRTILRVYAEVNEVILVASSAVGVNQGNILIYPPGTVPFNPVGNEAIPGAGTAVMDCMVQRGAQGPATRGFIANRVQELAGPNNIDVITGASLGGTGYVPCHYQVPAGGAGIYSVIMYGPPGNVTAGNGGPTGSIGHVGGNATAAQNSTIAYWDVTVRDVNGANETIAPDNLGRLFAFYLSMFTASNGRPVFLQVYPVSLDGYVYRTTMRGTDPNGFAIYGNSTGFMDSDGTTPLYRNVRGTGNGLDPLIGGVGIALPEFPIFFDQPDAAALAALAIPTAQPPVVSNLGFTGVAVGYTNVGNGGVLSFTSNAASNFELVISRDGVDFDPTTPGNRVLRGAAVVGANNVNWDGMDNTGVDFPESPGTPRFAYPFRVTIRAGEYHFPLLDAENNDIGAPSGGPTYELLNPPDITGDGVGDCPPWTGGCFGAFYDDRGYTTLAGTLVGTFNGDLCPLVVGNSNDNDPLILYSGLNGYDTRTDQRAFGFNTGNVGNPGADCVVNGGFGDAKGLDQWTYFPSNVTQSALIILPVGELPPTPTPLPSATPLPVTPAPTLPGGTPGAAATPAPGQPGSAVGTAFCLTEEGRNSPLCQNTVLSQVQTLPATGESPWSAWRSVIFGAGLGLLVTLALAVGMLWRKRTA